MNELRQISSGCKTLVDFEWRFAVSTGSSRAEGKSQCFIASRFLLREEGGAERWLQIDLSMGEFNQFFREMEKINNMIEIIN